MGNRSALCLALLLCSCDDNFSPADQAVMDLSAAADLPAMDLSVDLPPVDQAMPACVPPPFYPAPPYGYRAGRVIEDLQFQGKHDSNMSGRVDSADPVSTMSFHDYYQDPQTKLLVIVACAMWCAPCTAEQPSLNSLYQQYRSSGVQFVSAIMQSPSASTPTMANLNNWGAGMKVPYDLVLDASEQLGAYLPTAGFPVQMIVRTSDMQIVWLNAGADPAELQAQIDTHLSGAGDAGAPPPAMMCDLGGTPPPPDGGTLSFCDDCTSDGQCASGVCASDTSGGHFCARRCAVDEDCPQNVIGYLPFQTCVNDPGGKGMVCRPVGGVCHGAGALCDWCRPGVPADCAGGTTCMTSQFTGERFCSKACTVTATFDNGAYVYTNDTCPSGTFCDTEQSPACGPAGCTLDGGCTADPQHFKLTCHAPVPD